MGFVVNKNALNGKCTVQDEKERPQLGNPIAGPYKTRKVADKKKDELEESGECDC